jgi:hypothetical protein
MDVTASFLSFSSGNAASEEEGAPRSPLNASAHPNCKGTHDRLCPLGMWMYSDPNGWNRPILLKNPVAVVELSVAEKSTL